MSGFSYLCEAGRTDWKLLFPVLDFGLGGKGMGLFLASKGQPGGGLRRKGGPEAQSLRIPATMLSQTLYSPQEALHLYAFIPLTFKWRSELHRAHSLCINGLFGLGLMTRVFLCSVTCDTGKISCSLESGKSRAKSYCLQDGRLWTLLISTSGRNLLTFQNCEMEDKVGLYL